MAEEQGGPKRPHALVIFFPMQGPFNPMLTLARRLQSIGFTITAVTSDAYDDSNLAAMGFTVATYPDPKLDDDTKVDDFCKSEQWSIRHPIEHIVEGLQPNLFVFPSESYWVANLASRLQIPSVGLITLPVSTMLLFDHLSLLLDHIYQGVEDGQVKPDFCAPGLIPLGPFDIPVMMSCLGPPGPTSDFVLRFMEDMYKATWILINSFEELEHDALQALRARRPNTMAIGPLLPIDSKGKCFALTSRCWKEDSYCLQWLNSHPYSSVLYISFGSVSRMSQEQAEELVQGLEASKQPFLWVCRPNFLKNVSDAYLESLSERMKKQGLVIPWAPQVEVLRHRAVGGFMTHCGWNSVMESVSMGIPMLAWPHFAEQHTNAKYIVHKWKLGVRISNAELITKDEICAFVTKLMQGEEAKKMRMRAKKLSIASVAAIKKGGSSYANLQHVAESLYTYCLGSKL